MKLLILVLLIMILNADDYDLVKASHKEKIKEIPIKSWEYVDDFEFVEYKDEMLSVFYVNHYYMDADESIQSSIQNSLCRENAMRLYQFRLPTKTHCLFPPDVNATFNFLNRN